MDTNEQHRQNTVRLDRLEKAYSDLRDEFTQHKVLTQEIKADTGELVAILKYSKGVLKFFTLIAQISKFITVIGAASLVVWLIVKGRYFIGSVVK